MERGAKGGRLSFSGEIADALSSAEFVFATVGTPPAQPQVLLTLDGSGSKTTQKFTTGGDDWDLNWTYDCSAYGGGTGNLIVNVYNGDGSFSFKNAGVNQLGKGGADVEHFHSGGTFYLVVGSECKWHIDVKG